MAQVLGTSARHFAVAMMIATVVAVLAGFWIFLHNMYHVGAQQAYHLFGVEPYRRYEGWLVNPDHQGQSVLFEMGIGAVMTMLLMGLHHRFVWFPFHPVGYAVAAGWFMNAAWFSVFVSWAIKRVVLSVGGPRLYRRLIPFFVGLILGQHVIGGFWTILGAIQQHPVYRFFPYRGV